MWDTDSELRELRDANRRLQDQIDNLDPAQSDAHNDGVGITVQIGSTYPSAVGKYFSIHPGIITGNETEGSTATVAPDPNAVVITALCLGPSVPGLGIQVLYSIAPDGKYVFNF